MRTLLAVASVTLLIAGGFGCGDDTTTTTAADMAMKEPDMSMPHDMMSLTCAQVLTCEQACTDTTCAAACAAEANSTAKQALGAFVLCLYNACNPDAGNTNGSCSSPTDQSAGCINCINKTGQGAALGGTCHTEFMNCASM